MYRNTSQQKLTVFAFNTSDGTPVESGEANITAKISLDDATPVSITDTNPSEIERGFYSFDLTKAETNAYKILGLPESSASGVEVRSVPMVIYTEQAPGTIREQATWQHLGRRESDSKVYVDLFSFDQDSLVNPDDVAVTIYKGTPTNTAGTTTTKQTSNGITIINGVASNSGVVAVEIDTSVDTGDIGFWENGESYHCLITLDTDSEIYGADNLSIPVGVQFDLGFVQSDAKLISGDTDSASRLALSTKQIIPGTVDTGAVGSTNTSFESDDVTEATNDHYNGRTIIFTSGALIGQATSISDYTTNGGNGVFTIVALTEAPSNNDTFIII